jgi:HlyD family secretion protein
MKIFSTSLCVLSMVAALAGCSRAVRDTYQGYAEGEYVHVATSESGQLDQLLVNKGGQVEVGTPLFVLESASEAAALRQARGQLAAAEAQLQDIQVGKRPQELEVIRAQREQANAEAVKSAADLTRDEAQFEAGGIAQGQLDRSRAAAEASAARVREFDRQLDVAILPAREDQLQAQQAQVAAARASVEQVEWRVQQKAVNAPVAGLVFDTLYKQGEWVAAGRPVVRLLPPGNVKIRFFVPETVLGGLSMGQTVRLRCDGCAADISAKVSYISTEAEYTPPIIYSNETRTKLVFMVEAQPLDGAELHPGQPVQVSLK